ncbi:hypothetical protein ACFSO7_00300 [Bacillus sp. CGMCC 1.16607]|uniref:hypothetical protein n=1 Tax=Bacillus sp. CGMCC 1.16607 TaxID=3351842 RepID=UPI003635E606
MKKQAHDIRDLIYLHHNNLDQYVISYGIEFKEFIKSCSSNLNHLLLLKHRFNDAEFNMHTLLEYVSEDKVAKLINDGVYGYGNFCWIDFAEVEGLNELNGQEIAEILYLGHLKQHLKLPFYQKLANRFAYLAHDDGWFNKVYYRDMGDFYEILGNVLGLKLSENHTKKTIFNLRKSRSFPSIPGKTLTQFSHLLREGIVISLKKKEETRQRMEIPIWVLGDFLDMDDMYEEALSIENDPCHGKLIYDKKTNEWKVLL